jgi:hypothetical protein
LQGIFADLVPTYVTTHCPVLRNRVIFGNIFQGKSATDMIGSVVICPKIKKKGYIVMGKINYSCTQTTIDIRECKEQIYNVQYVIVIWWSNFEKSVADSFHH